MANQPTSAQVMTGLETALALAQAFAPLAALGGPKAAKIGQMVSTVAGTVEAVMPELVADAQILRSGDAARIELLQAQLQSENAALAQQIPSLPD